MKIKNYYIPYLIREPVKTANKLQCYYCGYYPLLDFRKTKKQRFLKTRDHILPYSVCKKLGYPQNLNLPGDGNFRPCCARCNTLRGRLDHCAGVLMLGIIGAIKDHKDTNAFISCLRKYKILPDPKVVLEARIAKEKAKIAKAEARLQEQERAITIEYLKSLGKLE